MNRLLDGIEVDAKEYDQLVNDSVALVTVLIQRDALVMALKDIEKWCIHAQASTGIKPYGLDVARAALARVQS